MGALNDLNVIRNARKTLIHLTMLTSIVVAAATSLSPAGINQNEEPHLLDNQIQVLPFCGDGHEHTIGRRLLYVTTLDGRLSALDITKGGNLRWSIPTGPGPLISSSIHRLDLTNDGRFVRMIPSLSGGIYKFDGESIDPIPINTEHLLSSSSKFSDELVVSGGKETRTYGVSVRTGQLLYECSMNGCINSTDAEDTSTTQNADGTAGNSEDRGDFFSEHDPLVDDVVIVRRQTQTVRAVESRTGIERWNFSVGQHDVDIVKPADCHDRHFSDLDMAILDLAIKVIVPEGIICAFSKSDPNVLLWKYKFDHPIVSAWKMGPSDELESIDLFGSAQWLWEQNGDTSDSLYPTLAPSIYLGMYDKQLYIQESLNIRKAIMDRANIYNEVFDRNVIMPKIPWRPIAAASNSLVVVQDDKIIGGSSNSYDGQGESLQGNELMPYDETMFAISAQSVLNASEYVNGNGYYFYTDNDLNKSTIESICNSDATTPMPGSVKEENANVTNNTMTDEFTFNMDDIDAPVKVVILSLWFWWKEILVIAFTSAVLLNLLIGQRSPPEREIVVIERHIPVPTAIEATEASTAALLGPVTNSTKSANNGNLTNGNRTLSESTSHSGSDQFCSRFQSDFDLLRCLGRGGFGVVFEAKNKLDDCKYAVKRITLPNKKESRDRVMREVKTLANCEHHNIVRYFQAWVENPPPGWQEEEDNKWLAHEMSSTSIQIETPTDGSTGPTFINSITEAQNRKLQMAKKKLLMSWVSSVASTACSDDANTHQNENGDDDDDSCIIFRSESQSSGLQENHHEDIGKEMEHAESVVAINHPNNRRNSSATAISIDIHSNSFDLGLKNGNHVDYSQLSDSFQIEFVRPADNDERSQESAFDDEVEALPIDKGELAKCNEIAKLSLDLVATPYPNENGKQILAVSSTCPKPSQNKVYLYIQMQLCRKESLRDWLRDNRTEARAAHIGRIFYQIVEAVDYVHLKGLIHRDLKPSNIFFSQDGQIKIGDFGLVTDMSDIPNMVNKCGDSSGLPSCARHTQQVGTHLYMSPEQLRGQHYDYKVDVYSLGLIFFELLVYFATEMERIVTLRDLRDGRYPKEFPVTHPGEYELLKKMLSTQSEERPNTSELKQRLNGLLKLPELIGGDADSVTAIAEAVRRFSCSRS